MITAETLEGFVSSVLVNRFDDAAGVPDFHRELWSYACSKDKYIAIAAPRGHAKSTAGTLAYCLASVLFRESKFVVIVSDTETQAAMFLGNIAQELRDNEAILGLFDLKVDDKGVAFEKDSSTDIIVSFSDGTMFRIVAKGAEQKLRGLNWNGTRPDLVIGDDLENDELVMNKERRAKLRRWFFGALLPVLSPKGKIRIWGTILHSDSLLESFMPNDTDKNTVTEDLKQYNQVKRGMWRGIKYRAHTDDFKKLLWPERFSVDSFKERQQEYIAQGISDVYSQEYLNRPIDDTVAFFKKKDFIPRKEDDIKKTLSYYIAGDLAISETQRADYTVFVVGGMDEDRVLHIVDVVRDRFDGKEIVDVILALQDHYKPELFGIEEMQVSKAIGPFLREEMMQQNTWPNLVPMKHLARDKVSRARSVQARMRARTVKFDTEADWYPTFEDELLRFPRSSKDDQVDAFAYLGLLLNQMIEAPTNAEQDEEDYLDELRESRADIYSRNRTTGY